MTDQPTTKFKPAEQYGPYLIIRPCGTGGMGFVYEGRHLETGQRVAIKIMRLLDPHGHEIKRFRREAEVVRRLDHPDIVKLREVGQHGDQNYLAMEYIDGIGLDKWIARHQPSIEQVLIILARVADAVHYAHGQGVIHRDLKPSNILIRADGAPCVADFGLAREIGVESSLTASESAVGTPAYMAPEQAMGEHRDCGPATDVWALGVILYRFCTGRLPFDGHTPFQISGAVVNEEPKRPRAIAPGVPRGVERIILNCLAKPIRERYPSAADLAADIRRHLEGESIASRRRSLSRRTRRRIAVGTIVVIAVIAVILGVLVARHWPTPGGTDEDGSRSEWLQVWSWDGGGDPLDTGLVDVEFTEISRDLPASRGESGWIPERYRWYWIDEVRIPGDVRVEFDLSVGSDPNSIEIAINSRREPIAYWSAVPIGYSAQVGSFYGTVDFVSRNEQAGSIGNFVHTQPGEIRSGRRYRIAFQRVGDEVALQTNDLPPLRRSFPVPIAATGLEHVGFRSYARDLAITGIRVYRRATTETSPLLAGDTALRFGSVDQAIDEYHAISQVAENREVAARALGRAYLLARFSGQGSGAGRAYRDRLAKGYRDTEAWRVVSMVEAAELHREGSPDALAAIDAILEEDPDSPVMTYVMEARSLADMRGGRQPILERVAQSRDIRALMLGGRFPVDLEIFRDGRLFWLHANNQQIDDLGPLAGQPIEFLFVSSNPLDDLSPLRGMPLRCLAVGRGEVTDLGPLADVPTLRWLSLHESGVRDLSPLAGLPLYHLHLAASRVRDLSPLAGMPLVQLEVGGCEIDTLDPLAGAPLEILDLTHCRASVTAETLRSWKLERLLLASAGWSTLEKLRGLGLDLLIADGNRISDLAPLAGSQLRVLSVGDNRIRDLRPLQGLPLTQLACHANPLSAEGLRGLEPPREFLFGDSLDTRMDPDALDALIRLFASRDELALHAEAARALRHYHRYGPAALRDLARATEGGRYLYLPLWLERREVRPFLEAIGATLVRRDLAKRGPGTLYPRGARVWCSHGKLDVQFVESAIHTDQRRGAMRSLLLFWPEEE